MTKREKFAYHYMIQYRKDFFPTKESKDPKYKFEDLNSFWNSLQLDDAEKVPLYKEGEEKEDKEEEDKEEEDEEEEDEEEEDEEEEDEEKEDEEKEDKEREDKEKEDKEKEGSDIFFSEYEELFDKGRWIYAAYCPASRLGAALEMTELELHVAAYKSVDANDVPFNVDALRNWWESTGRDLKDMTLDACVYARLYE